MPRLSSSLGVLQHRNYSNLALTDSTSSISWSDALKCWCVFNPALISEIFKNKDFHVTDYRGELAKIAERIDIDFSASNLALSFVPLAQEDDEHRSSRRNL